MKTLKTLLLLTLALPILMSCGNAQSQEKQETTVSDNTITVYYFHNTRRCATCNAVEEVSKTTVNELYADQVKDGKIKFEEYNVEEDENKELAEKLQVAGQALLIIKGSERVDLTQVGFMNARSTPDVLKEKIKETIDGLI